MTGNASSTTPPTARIQSIVGDSFVQFTLGQRMNGDGELAVEIQSQGFSGKQDVWFETYELGRFATELRRYACDAKGPINLRSMSPEKFMLDIVPFANKDRGLVTVRLQRHAFWGDPRFAQSLFAAFEWYRSETDPLIRQVDTLLAAMRATGQAEAPQDFS